MTNKSKVQALFRELSDKELDDGQPLGHNAMEEWGDSVKLWLQSFHEYLNTCEHIGDLSIVHWWGINMPHYPVWGSLAHNFLSIVAIFVSSEHVFSSAGMTISKWWICLKADIVEALQFAKCYLKKELLFHEDPLVATDIQGLESTLPLGATDLGCDISVEDSDNDNQEDDVAHAGDEDDVFFPFLTEL